jgi:hypothetical protein
MVKSLCRGGPLSHKQGGLIHQFGVWLGCDLKIILLLLLVQATLSLDAVCLQDLLCDDILTTPKEQSTLDTDGNNNHDFSDLLEIEIVNQMEFEQPPKVDSQHVDNVIKNPQIYVQLVSTLLLNILDPMNTHSMPLTLFYKQCL